LVVIPQFTLRALFVGVAIAAGYCALLARWPLLFGALLVPMSLFGLVYWLAKRTNADAAVVATCVIVGLLLLALLLPALQSGYESGTPRRNTCMNNLHQIGLALASYHARHGCYPPAYGADARGRPLVSWRVLLLPYMEQRPLYDQWKQHRDEPWNGPHNGKVSQTVLEFLHCPSDNGPITDTSYVAIVGPGTIWPGTAQVGNSQITDGTSNTLILVEVANSGINWMESRDLDFANRSPGINSKVGLGVSSNHPAIVCVQFADGRTTTLDESITEQQLQALLTIAGGEKVVLP
jgi:hypothetical protein